MAKQNNQTVKFERRGKLMMQFGNWKINYGKIIMVRQLWVSLGKGHRVK